MENIYFSQVKDKKKLLSSFDPQNSLWIVPDIKSKLFVGQWIKEQASFDNGSSVEQMEQADCVMRAGEFWHYCLSKISPKTLVVSRPFMVRIYQEWAKNLKNQWQRGADTGNLLCHYISALGHLLQHPLREPLIEEWQKEWQKTQPKKSLYWIQWQQLGIAFLQHLSPTGSSEIAPQIIEESWLSGFLLSLIEESPTIESVAKGEWADTKGLVQTKPFAFLKKYKQIIFDMSFEIDDCEKELIKQISRLNIQTKLLVPKPTKEAKNSTIKCKKFATALAEVKDISAYVGELIKKGIPATSISVLAPRIEDYWISLKSHLQKEGVPVNKTDTTRLISFYDTQFWLGKMWTHLSVVRYEYLSAMSAHLNPHQNFSQLKAKAYHIKDLTCWTEDHYSKAHLKDKQQCVPFKEFLAWALALRPTDPENDMLKKSFGRWVKKVKQVKGIYLSWANWLTLLEAHLKKEEITIRQENGEGIQCLSFNALSCLTADYVYVAGLSEQNLINPLPDVLPVSQAESISKNLGFCIRSSPIDKMERVIEHFIDQGQKELILSFATSDFANKPLSPSLLWLNKAMALKRDIQHFDTPKLSQWDKVGKAVCAPSPNGEPSLTPHLLEESHPIPASAFRAIQEDRGLKQRQPYRLVSEKWTASLLESYGDCPFIFSAKRGFLLSDRPEQNMDLSAIEKGILLHRVFEHIRNKLNQGAKIDKPVILELIEEIYKNLNTDSNKPLNYKGTDPLKLSPLKPSLKKQKLHPIIWEKEKQKILQKALFFLEWEQKTKGLFSTYKNQGLELRWEGYWSLKQKTLIPFKGGDFQERAFQEGQKSEQDDTVRFSGVVDRVDSDGKNYHIIDYKGALPTGSSAPAWVKENKFQMALYIAALEKGLTALPKGPVNLSLYLSYKDFSFKGFALKEPEYIKLFGSRRPASLMPMQGKQEIIRQVNQTIQDFILKIKAGHFPAKPHKKSLCPKCHLRKICRASHLN